MEDDRDEDDKAKDGRENVAEELLPLVMVVATVLGHGWMGMSVDWLVTKDEYTEVCFGFTLMRIFPISSSKTSLSTHSTSPLALPSPPPPPYSNPHHAGHPLRLQSQPPHPTPNSRPTPPIAANKSPSPPPSGPPSSTTVQFPSPLSCSRFSNRTKPPKECWSTLIDLQFKKR